MTKTKVGNLEISADFWGNKDWCVQVKGPKETLRFFIPCASETVANSQAAILADMIRSSQGKKEAD